MKIRIIGIIFSTLLFLSLCIYATGCTCNPFGAIQPYFIEAAYDKEGGAVILWSSRDNELKIQRIDDQGNQLWNSGRPISINIQAKSTIGWSKLVDDVNGSFVIWSIRPDGDQDYKFYAQRIDNGGQSLWGPIGFSVSDQLNSQERPNVISDGLGGIVISWENVIYTENGQITENKGLFAQRIDDSGKRLWTDVGIPFKLQSYITDDAGGILGIFSISGKNLICEKIDKNGNTVWSTSIFNLAGNGGISYSNLVTDGNGGAIIGWQSYTQNVNHFDYIFQLQRIDPNGNLLWPKTVINEISHEQDRPQMISNDSGGVILLINTYYEVIDINSNGEMQWTASIPVNPSITSREGYPLQLSGASDGTSNFLTWQNPGGMPTEGGTICAQKLDNSGNYLWNNKAVQTFSSENFKTQIYPSIVDDGSGGAIIIAQVGKSSHGADSIRVQRLDKDGNIMWGTEGILIDQR